MGHKESPRAFAHSIGDVTRGYMGDMHEVLPARAVDLLHEGTGALQRMLADERRDFGFPLAVENIVVILNTAKRGDDPLRFAITMVEVNHHLVKDLSDVEKRFFLDLAAAYALLNYKRTVTRHRLVEEYFPGMSPMTIEQIKGIKKDAKQVSRFRTKLREYASPNNPQTRK